MGNRRHLLIRGLHTDYRGTESVTEIHLAEKTSNKKNMSPSYWSRIQPGNRKLLNVFDGIVNGDMSAIDIIRRDPDGIRHEVTKQFPKLNPTSSESRLDVHAD
jgi:hypothetical protein